VEVNPRVAQWTVDPSGPASPALRAKARAVLDRRPDLVVRHNRNWFTVPSWTRAGVDYQVTVVFAATGWRVTCDCPAPGQCHHGWVAVIVAEATDGTRAPQPWRPSAAVLAVPA
jgi:hypothetical protein